MTSLTPDDTLLGLLAAQAAHGYQLIHCFRDPAHLGEVWNLSVSQLYAVLKRLEQQRLIKGQQVENRINRAPPESGMSQPPAALERHARSCRTGHWAVGAGTARNPAGSHYEVDRPLRDHSLQRGKQRTVEFVYH